MIYTFRPRWLPVFAVACQPGTVGVAFGLTRAAARRRFIAGRRYEIFDEGELR